MFLVNGEWLPGHSSHGNLNFNKSEKTEEPTIIKKHKKNQDCQPSEDCTNLQVEDLRAMRKKGKDSDKPVVK